MKSRLRSYIAEVIGLKKKRDPSTVSADEYISLLKSTKAAHLDAVRQANNPPEHFSRREAREWADSHLSRANLYAGHTKRTLARLLHYHQSRDIAVRAKKALRE